MATQRQHPSVRFQNNEVKDFYTATNIYAAQYREELRLTRDIQREYGGVTTREFLEQQEAVHHIEQMCEQARAIYREIVGEAEARAAAIMRAAGDDTLNQLADALEQDDYAQLAI